MTPAAPQPVAKTERAQPKTETEAGPIRQTFRAAVKPLTQPAPKRAAAKKQKRSGEDDKGRAGMRFVGRYAVLKNAAPPSMDADPRGLVPEPLDSMNPYCEPDAYLTGLEIDESYNPPQDHYPLQL
jgi:hypothetical protein